MLRFFLTVMLITVVLIASSLGIFVIESVDQTQADNKERSKLEFDAVHNIHNHLDDDKNGDVDFTESKEFLQHELEYIHDTKRHSKFHSGDGSISVEELWEAWSNSEVCNWTADEVANWLRNVVHLPQYADIFIKEQINGRSLPSLASSADDMLLNKLKILNVIDRKKIALRAMDVVLFGAPKGHNYLKDLVLGLAVLIAMAGFWFSNVQKRKAQKQMETMLKDVECLQEAEKNLTGLQSRLHEAEVSHQTIQQEKFLLESNLKNEIETAKCEAQRLREAREDESGETHTRLKLAEEELFQVSEALRKAEKELEYLSSLMTSSNLQKWLHITYQKEVKNFIHRRASALRKMESAKEACDRINRKRNSVFGSLRLVHDQNIDEVDRKILSARCALAEVTSELEELQHRWQQIEACCRLNLGVCSSLALDVNDTPSASLGQAIAYCGKIGTLGSPKSNSRESLTLRRVVTCPSFQPLNDNIPSYCGVSKSKVARDATASANGKFSEVTSVTDELESEPSVSENASNTEHSNAELNASGSYSDCKEVNCDQLDTESEKPIGAEKTPLASSPATSGQNTSGSTNTRKKGNGENGTTQVIKAKKNPEKSFLHKKKWWSRNKRQHSLETDPESETYSEEGRASSLPILPQVKDSVEHSHDDKCEHPLAN